MRGSFSRHRSAWPLLSGQRGRRPGGLEERRGKSRRLQRRRARRRGSGRDRSGFALPMAGVTRVCLPAHAHKLDARACALRGRRSCSPQLVARSQYRRCDGEGGSGMQYRLGLVGSSKPTLGCRRRHRFFKSGPASRNALPVATNRPWAPSRCDGRQRKGRV
eukprot:364694-Chlamydomonas_euryale.AAC.6